MMVNLGFSFPVCVVVDLQLRVIGAGHGIFKGYTFTDSNNTQHCYISVLENGENKFHIMVKLINTNQYKKFSVSIKTK